MKAEAKLKGDRKKTYEMTQEKYLIECELANYIRWIQEDIENDQQNLLKCEEVMQTLNIIQDVHSKYILNYNC